MSEEYDMFAELGRLLEEAGLRATFDPGRTFKAPCHWCGTTETPRELTDIGSYIIYTNGGIQPKDALTRPLCEDCRK